MESVLVWVLSAIAVAVGLGLGFVVSSFDPIGRFLAASGRAQVDGGAFAEK